MLMKLSPGVRLLQVTKNNEPESDAKHKNESHDDDDDNSPMKIEIERKWRNTISSDGHNFCLIVKHVKKRLIVEKRHLSSNDRSI